MAKNLKTGSKGERFGCSLWYSFTESVENLFENIKIKNNGLLKTPKCYSEDSQKIEISIWRRINERKKGL